MGFLLVSTLVTVSVQERVGEMAVMRLVLRDLDGLRAFVRGWLFSPTVGGFYDSRHLGGGLVMAYMALNPAQDEPDDATPGR